MLKELGKELHKVRTERGESLDAIAGKAGISGAYLHKLERGLVNNPSPRVLARVAGALELPYLHLMELAGYITAEDALQIGKREPRPVPHPLENRELSPAEWEEVGNFINALVTRRQ